MSLEEVREQCYPMNGELLEVFYRNWELPAFRELLVYTMRRCKKLLKDKKSSRGNVRWYEATERHTANETLRYIAHRPAKKLKRPSNKFIALVLKTKDLGDYSDVILLAVKAGVDPRREPCKYSNKTVLSIVVKEGRVDVVNALLALGSPPSGKPLNCALHHQKRDIVRILIDVGADPNFIAQDIKGEVSPLSVALAGDDFELVHILLVAGANPATADEGVLADLPLSKLERFLDVSGYSLAAGSDLLSLVCDEVYGEPCFERLNLAVSYVCSSLQSNLTQEETEEWREELSQLARRHPVFRQWRAKLDMLMKRPGARDAAGKYAEHLARDYPAK